jgi:hypothetical protein
MRKHDGKERAVKGAIEGAARKRYASPRLTVYGDLRRLTLAKGSNKSEGAGSPPTRP